MPVVNFSPVPADFQELVSAFAKRIEQCEKRLADFERRQCSGIREDAVIYCLDHAVDVGKGCLVTALAELPDSLTTLSRALLETLFWSRYVTLSQENAQKFADHTANEMRRVARKNLSASYARISDTKTGDDRAQEILESPLMKDIPRRISIEDAARLGGLERVYTKIYGFISIMAHGKAFGLSTKAENKEEILASVSVALGALQGIEIIATDWITDHKQTSRETLMQILGA